MNKPPLNLAVGAMLHLEPTTQGPEYSFDTTLIGYVQGESLLVSKPINNDMAIKLMVGTPYKARIAAGDSVYAFQTQILRICAQPYQYMHLDFPAGIQGVALRRAQRLSVDERALVLNIQEGGVPLSVTMLDISPLGARLIAEQPLGKIGDYFCIDIQHKSATEQISFPCFIRRIHNVATANGDSVFHHGVEFSKLDAKAIAFISQFIKDNVTKQREG